VFSVAAEQGDKSKRSPVNFVASQLNSRVVSSERRNTSVMILQLGRLISGMPAIVAADPEIENPMAFAMESHLEDLLAQNWSQDRVGQEVRHL